MAGASVVTYCVPARPRALPCPVCAMLTRLCMHPRQQTDQWQWKYDAATKQGKWELAAPKKQPEQCGAEEPARQRRTLVTMAELEEDQRKAADRRAAELRRETAKRMKRKQMLAAKKAQEEEQLRVRALEQRRAEIEEKRQLMNAGARVRVDEVYFDDIEPAAPSSHVGEGVMRPARPAAQPKPQWNSGVGPGSAPRQGFQPASLIPPPALPPSRSQRNASAAASRAATGATAASRVGGRPAHGSERLCPPAAEGEVGAGMRAFSTAGASARP